MSGRPRAPSCWSASSNAPTSSLAASRRHVSCGLRTTRCPPPWAEARQGNDHSVRESTPWLTGRTGMRPASEAGETGFVSRRRRSEDVEGWHEIVRRFAPYVHAVCVAHGLTEDGAEPVFDEVFTRMWTEIDRLEDDDALRARVTATDTRRSRPPTRRRPRPPNVLDPGRRTGRPRGRPRAAGVAARAAAARCCGGPGRGDDRRCTGARTGRGRRAAAGRAHATARSLAPTGRQRPRRAIDSATTGHDREECGLCSQDSDDDIDEFLRSLPPAPESWVSRAEEMPLLQKALTVLRERQDGTGDARGDEGGAPAGRARARRAQGARARAPAGAQRGLERLVAAGGRDAARCDAGAGDDPGDEDEEDHAPVVGRRDADLSLATA